MRKRKGNQKRSNTSLAERWGWGGALRGVVNYSKELGHWEGGAAVEIGGSVQAESLKSGYSRGRGSDRGTACSTPRDYKKSTEGGLITRYAKYRPVVERGLQKGLKQRR